MVAFVQAFGHHDDIGGAVPGSMPSHATSAHQEGLMVPPVKLYDAGRPNRDVIRILVRNSRLPDSLRGDLDSEVAACRLGAARLGALFRRYGAAQVEACFEAILARTTETFRRELLARIPDGTHVWEDYAEHDGVDPPRLHAQRITLTKAGGRLILDFAGTSPQATRPDQPRRRLRRRRVPQEVARPDPAQPRRHARADGRAGRQRGRRPADRAPVPAARHAC